MTPPPRRAGGTARAAPPLRPAAADRRTTQTLSLAPVDNRALAVRQGDRDSIFVHTFGGHAVTAVEAGPGLLDGLVWAV